MARAYACAAPVMTSPHSPGAFIKVLCRNPLTASPPLLQTHTDVIAPLQWPIHGPCRPPQSCSDPAGALRHGWLCVSVRQPASVRPLCLELHRPAPAHCPVQALMDVRPMTPVSKVIRQDDPHTRILKVCSIFACPLTPSCTAGANLKTWGQPVLGCCPLGPHGRVGHLASGLAAEHAAVHRRRARPWLLPVDAGCPCS